MTHFVRYAVHLEWIGPDIPSFWLKGQLEMRFHFEDKSAPDADREERRIANEAYAIQMARRTWRKAEARVVKTTTSGTAREWGIPQLTA